MPAPTPPTLLEAIASAAGPSFITNPMPNSPTGTNAASIQGGFPPVTMTNEQAGGEPPLGQDMNGYMFLISSHTLYVQTGQLYPYNSTLAAAIGGYALGTILGMADGTGIWMNITANNTSNPDTGGAGWISISSYGIAAVPVTTGAVNLTASEYRRSIIQFTGTLTGNVTVVFPNIVEEWLLVNSTSGPFTLLAIAGSAGVVIPQGGFATPTGVYCVGDTNLYPTVSPLSVAIDQNPTPLTLVERTNAGYVLATYFNSNNGADNFTIQNVFYDSGDGFHRKKALSTFESQLLLQAMGGQVSNGQVPYSVIQQWVSTFLDNANLTGIPVAPTAGIGTSNLQIANTQFVNPGTVPTQYRRNPDGTIDQWGVDNTGGAAAINFPIPFPTAVTSIELTAVSSGAVQTWVKAGTLTRTQFQPQTTGGAIPIYWRAIGY